MDYKTGAGYSVVEIRFIPLRTLALTTPVHALSSNEKDGVQAHGFRQKLRTDAYRASLCIYTCRFHELVLLDSVRPRRAPVERCTVSRRNEGQFINGNSTKFYCLNDPRSIRSHQRNVKHFNFKIFHFRRTVRSHRTIDLAISQTLNTAAIMSVFRGPFITYFMLHSETSTSGFHSMNLDFDCSLR